MTASIVAATFIATEGEYLEAVIEVGGQRLHVMDEFGGGQMAAGAHVQLELWPMPGEMDDWDAIFRANPGEEKRLQRLDGWRYGVGRRDPGRSRHLRLRPVAAGKPVYDA